MSHGDLQFEPPGPGTWILDGLHSPTPMTRFRAEYQTPLSMQILSQTILNYGGFISLSSVVINGFIYGRVTPIGRAPGEIGAPSINDPEVQQQIARAFEVHRTDFGNEQRRRWFEEIKPDSIETNLNLASVSVEQLDDDELLAHMSRSRDNLIEMTRRHFAFGNTSELPAAMLMADVADWTDLSLEDAVSLLDGASPISSGVTPELEALTSAIRLDSDAQVILGSAADEPEAILEGLLQMPGAVGDAMARFLLIDGHFPATSQDVTGKMAVELPEIMIANIAEAVESGLDDHSSEMAMLARFVRERVPPEHRESFDTRLEDARAAAPIKDEKGLYNDGWARGIVRKALMESGRRLATKGRISDAEDFFEADWVEMQAIWAGATVPTEEELANRRNTRASYTWRDAPPYLGTPPSPPAQIAGLPPEIVSWNATAQALRQAASGAPPAQDAPDLVGITASGGSHQGTARVVIGDYDFQTIGQGDVLVASIHSSAFNAVARRVGAIVADTGGPLSHLAIISRELGIPCVVACKNATALIPDGALVRVEADAGTVTVVE
jgi:pyruvate,water dikinase